MISFIKNIINRLLNIENIHEKLKDVKILTGKFLLEKKNDSENINDHELKIFSQFGEDGIINYLTKKIEIKDKTFIEFGVEDYEEANTRFLLEARNWKGLIFDSSIKNINKIKRKDYYWKFNLIAEKEFITAENINEIIRSKFNNEEIGLMSIDVDGNDYWIWKSLEIVKPKIIVIEYNARFGSDKSVVVPYNKNFNRIVAHYSSIYFGASLKALNNLAKTKDYSLIGTNLNGNNAFFVCNSELEKIKIKKKTPEECFHTNSFNELRDKSGKIVERNIEEEKKILKQLPLEKVL
jgi:hypothetical protein